MKKRANDKGYEEDQEEEGRRVIRKEEQHQEREEKTEMVKDVMEGEKQKIVR